MTGKKWVKAVALVALGMVLLIGVAHADSSISIVNPLGSSCMDLSCVTTKIINFLFTLAVPLCGILVLVGGFQMMTAAGDPEKFSKGKKTLLYAAIGFVVILLAGSVAALIQNIL